MYAKFVNKKNKTLGLRVSMDFYDLVDKICRIEGLNKSYLITKILLLYVKDNYCELDNFIKFSNKNKKFFNELELD
jgi:hypothetical protein